MSEKPFPAFLAALILCACAALAQAQSEEGTFATLHDESGAVAGYKIASDLNFTKGSMSLSPQGRRVLEQLFLRLSGDEAIKVSIYGYADSSGKAEINRQLTNARAREIKRHLLSLGLAEERVAEVKGMGSLDPVAGNDTEEGRRMNRRVEIHIAGMKPVRAEPLEAPKAEAPLKQDPGHVGPPRRFALGIGYPDLRARLALGRKVDAEAKFAFGDGIQVYSARLHWNFADLGPLKLTAGAEGGYVRFDGVHTISGTGALGSGFLGIEYPFAGRLRLNADVGPAWLQASSGGRSHSTTELIYNTALYFYLF